MPPLWGVVGKKLSLKYDLQVENICTLDRYDDSVSEKVLALLLEWACYGQHMSGLVMGRRKIALIDQDLDIAVYTLAASLDAVGLPKLEDV